MTTWQFKAQYDHSYLENPAKFVKDAFECKFRGCFCNGIVCVEQKCESNMEALWFMEE